MKQKKKRCGKLFPRVRVPDVSVHESLCRDEHDSKCDSWCDEIIEADKNRYIYPHACVYDWIDSRGSQEAETHPMR